jgi:ABC-type multidrug transport system fused ATPase/permease subunit
MLAIAGGLFWTTFNGRLTAVNAFTTLAIIAIVINPLTEILKSYPQLKGISACFTRIQKYLVLEEVQSRHRISTHSSEDTEEPKLEKKTDDIIRFEKASITPAAGVNTILHNVTFNVQPSQFTVVLGPVGAGKTTLLRAILGEAAVCDGDFRRNPDNLAYCGQKPWLRNVSIRANIIATSGFEKAWYDEVIAACCLVNDLDQLPGSKGDKSLAGSNGSNLSGGQRHRVVSFFAPAGLELFLTNKRQGSC